MKKKIIFVLALCGVLNSLTLNVNALSNDKIYNYGEKEYKGSELKQNLCQTDINDIVFPDSINLDGTEIELYCEFENRDDALKETNDKYFNEINLLKDTYNISGYVASETIEDYKNAINNASMDIPEVNNDILRNFAKIRAVLGIYEDNDLNDNIKELANSYKISSDTKKTEIMKELDMIIPNYSDNFASIKPRLGIARVGSSLNVSKATAYAKTWATSSNQLRYHYFPRGDCTNFVSQILENSGIQQVVSNSEYSGWWHKEPSNYYLEHKHSRSWTMADTFARYMGVTVKTSDISSWANGLNEGDFIALDFEGNGSWDHMGYVTEKSSTNKAYVDDKDRGVCFPIPDIKIAQHTSNYHKWISEEKNGWETYYGVGIYGRIRG